MGLLKKLAARSLPRSLRLVSTWIEWQCDSPRPSASHIVSKTSIRFSHVHIHFMLNHCHLRTSLSMASYLGKFAGKALIGSKGYRWSQLALTCVTVMLCSCAHDGAIIKSAIFAEPLGNH